MVPLNFPCKTHIVQIVGQLWGNDPSSKNLKEIYRIFEKFQSCEGRQTAKTTPYLGYAGDVFLTFPFP